MYRKIKKFFAKLKEGSKKPFESDSLNFIEKIQPFYKKFCKGLTFKFTLFSLLAVILPAVMIAMSLIWIGRKALTESLYVQQLEMTRRISDRISVHARNVKSVVSIAAAP